jgi:LysM repeat protein
MTITDEKDLSGGAEAMKILATALVAISCMATSVLASAQASLAGSRASMEAQHSHAVRQGYMFAQTSRDVTTLANNGQLVRVSATQHMAIHNVSYPYLRPQVKTLLERLSTQYFSACGEQLTVTSMTRPIARQPANAHNDSVHPTGMAFDLRIPSNSRCRTWLERTLLSLEDSSVLDVTRERNPPHYHVAVFPEPYQRYLAGVRSEQREYTVKRGDTLAGIASRMNTSVAQLRASNGIRGDLIRVGQTLTIQGGTVQEAQPAVMMQASAPAPVSRELTHRVQSGETLWRIASRYRTSVDALRSQNGLADDLLRVGQVLRIVMDES